MGRRKDEKNEITRRSINDDVGECMSLIFQFHMICVIDHFEFRTKPKEKESGWETAKMKCCRFSIVVHLKRVSPRIVDRGSVGELDRL
jgi:hypothetical protein